MPLQLRGDSALKPYLPRLVLGVGIVFLVVSACLCLFIVENSSYLGDPTCQRVLSFLADHGYFDTTKPGQETVALRRIAGAGHSILAVSADYVGTRIWWVRIPEDAAQPVTADTTYPQPEEFRALWASFDRQRHPINPGVARAALLKNMSTKLEWVSRYSAHHFSLPYDIVYGLAWVGLRVSLPLLGTHQVLSLCRLGVPVWLSAVVTAAGMVWYRRARRRG